MSHDTPQPTGPGSAAGPDTTPEQQVEGAVAEVTDADVETADAAPVAEAADAAPDASPAEEVPAFVPPAPAGDPSIPDTYTAPDDVYDVPAVAVAAEGPGLFAKLGAEAFGAFFLVLAGLGIALYSNFGTALGGGALGTGLGFGIAALAGIVAVGHVSGGHFNPAVTFGTAIAGRTPWKDVLPYWIAQVVGGTVAAAVLFLAIPATLPKVLSKSTTRDVFSGVANGYGAHSPLAVAVDSGTSGQMTAEFTLVAALLVEVVVTAIFLGVILGATDRRANRAHAPFAIGLTLAILLVVAIPVTNGSLNPARSTAAAIFGNTWALKELWLFWVAPLLGAAIAGLVYRAFAAEPAEEEAFEDDAYATDEDAVVVEAR